MIKKEKKAAKKFEGRKVKKEEKILLPKYPAEDLVRFYDLSDYEARKLYIKDQISPKTLYTEKEFEEIVKSRYGNRR